MSIWDKFERSPRFFLKIGIFCLIIVFVFLICQKKDKPFSVQVNPFDQSQYLFSKDGEVAGTFDLNVVEGAFLKPSGPPFLVSGKSLASLDDFLPKDEAEQYIVEEGDTITSLAEKFGISKETILWANNLASNSIIKPGQKLIILPVSGVLHLVEYGDTVSTIAQTYKIEAEEIIEVNELFDINDIYAGDFLIIPGVLKPKVVQKYTQVPLAGNYFICPIPSPCRVTQGLHWFNAVDFSNGKCGEPVFAAAGGTVQRTGYGSVSGNYVRISHPNGVITFYGHLSKISVIPGQQVSQGQIIGYVGHTGLTIPAGEAGCHVHFDVRFAANPFAGYPVGATLGR